MVDASPQPKRRTVWIGLVSLVGGIGIGVGASAYRRQPPPPPPIEENSFLNFDAETTSREALSDGWAGYEHDESNDSFVWCTALQCTLIVTVHGVRDRRVSMRLWPFRYPGAPPQSVRANLNGVAVGTLVLNGEPQVWELRVDKGQWKEGKNALRFDFAHADAPATRIPGSADQRLLATCFDWLEILAL